MNEIHRCVLRVVSQNHLYCMGPETTFQLVVMFHCNSLRRTAMEGYTLLLFKIIFLSSITCSCACF
jgi:hypothetical protein